MGHVYDDPADVYDARREAEEPDVDPEPDDTDQPDFEPQWRYLA